MKTDNLHTDADPTVGNKDEGCEINANSRSHIQDSDVTSRQDESPVPEGMAMPRPRYYSPKFSDGELLIAVDDKTDRWNSMLGVHVGALIGRLPEFAVEEFKMGMAIADRTAMEISPNWLAAILGLKTVDPELKRSLDAALCAVLATTVAPVDIATLLFGIGNLIHAHPFFSNVVKNASWEHPYGERTSYQIALFAPLNGDESEESGVSAKDLGDAE
jgi:hypothetical protein